MKRRSFVAAIFAMFAAVIAMVAKLFGLAEAKAAPPKCAPAQGPRSICNSCSGTEVWANGDVLSYYVEQSIVPTFDVFQPAKVFCLSLTGHYHVGEKEEVLVCVPIVIRTQEDLGRARLAVRGMLSKYPPGRSHKRMGDALEWVAVEMVAPLAKGLPWRKVTALPHAWTPIFPMTDDLV